MSTDSPSMAAPQSSSLKRPSPPNPVTERWRAKVPRLGKGIQTDSAEEIIYNKVLRARLARNNRRDSRDPPNTRQFEEGEVRIRLKELSRLTTNLIHNILGTGSPNVILSTAEWISPLEGLSKKIRNGMLTTEEHGPFLSLLRKMFHLTVEDDLASLLDQKNNQSLDITFRMMLASIIGFWLYENILCQVYLHHSRDANGLGHTLGVSITVARELSGQAAQKRLQDGISGRLDSSDEKVAQLVADFTGVLTPYVNLLRDDDPTHPYWWGRPRRCEEIVRGSLTLVNDMIEQRDCIYWFFMPSMFAVMDAVQHKPDPHLSILLPAEGVAYEALPTWAGVHSIIFGKGQEEPMVAAEALVLLPKKRMLHPSQYYSISTRPEVEDQSETPPPKSPYSPYSMDEDGVTEWQSQEPENKNGQLVSLPPSTHHSKVDSVDEVNHNSDIRISRNRQDNIPVAQGAVVKFTNTQRGLRCPYRVGGVGDAFRRCREVYQRDRSNGLYTKMYYHIRLAHADDFDEDAHRFKLGVVEMFRRSLKQGRITIADLTEPPSKENASVLASINKLEEQAEGREQQAYGDQDSADGELECIAHQTRVAIASSRNVDGPVEMRLSKYDETGVPGGL